MSKSVVECKGYAIYAAHRGRAHRRGCHEAVDEADALHTVQAAVGALAAKRQSLQQAHNTHGTAGTLRSARCILWPLAMENPISAAR